MTQYARLKRRLWIRRRRRIANALVTLIVLGASGAAVQYGAGYLAARAEAAEAPVEAPLMPVEVRALTVEDSFTIPRQFVGQIEAATQATLAFELGVLCHRGTLSS
ncbi:MAG: hypothetical protein AAFO93_10705 [Pseudomonadota bacterium]